MSYENAPATRMLNTHCCACARPLLDAASVTAGLGPHCRKKHGVPSGLDEETRERANKLIFECAREHVDVETLQAAVVELALLGCHKLADRISKRAGRIVIRVTEDAVDVVAPYCERFLRARGPGRWVRDARATRYAKHDAYAAITAVREGFGDTVLVRFEDGDRVGFFSADDDRLDGTIVGIVESVPKPEPKPAPAEARWQGSPKQTRAGAWGVLLPVGAMAEPGQTVRVTTRGGKSWVARLERLDSRRSWGQIWATSRI